ncbi:hypothetical protein PoB_005189100 [Plakobranchus ocellatus]|uniref:Uncharacterized protein n=1 Tax=Plakobranchus ocellatus TaxID=259542 RepID=A0AAV4BXW9_9GAST|nr:hypothetical protein PoB_005189100 [Plakobranchus ocellatus]
MGVPVPVKHGCTGSSKAWVYRCQYNTGVPVPVKHGCTGTSKAWVYRCQHNTGVSCKLASMGETHISGSGETECRFLYRFGSFGCTEAADFFIGLRARFAVAKKIT